MAPSLRFIAPFSAIFVLGGTSACSMVKVRIAPRNSLRQAVKSAEKLGSLERSLADFAPRERDLLRQTRHRAHTAPSEVAANALLAAVGARDQLSVGRTAPDSEAEHCLLEVHNRALARFAEHWIAAGAPPQIACEATRLVVRFLESSDYTPEDFDRVIDAQSLREKGVQRQMRQGLGAALVGIRERRPDRGGEVRFYPLRGLHVPATLTIANTSQLPDGRLRVDLSLEDPLSKRFTSLGQRRFALAADYSAPIAMVLDQQSEVALGLKGFFDAATRAESSGIFLTAPYDQDRIPVLLIHGLISVPMIWRDLVPQLMAVPELAEHYQFLVFAYPSAYPITESAALLRRQLSDLRAQFDPEGDDPLSRNMVVAGHSMGGILAHTLVAEVGDRLWSQFQVATPLDQLPLPAERIAHLRELLFFDPDPAVRRAIFFSAPHRGARMAEKDFASLLSRAAKLPAEVMATTQLLWDPEWLAHPELRALRHQPYTSAQSLRPGAPMIAALDASPMRPGVVYHSIIGDRGRGDSPNSSDGIVDYWSSHLEGAASERIVPSNHRSYKDPAAVEEMKRILYEHIALPR